ncbi:MAG TPA: hypothetical protein VG867_03095 [Rhizomicrobium sp.]|nr:hypothetical protein [Rhizomicrobium sp.]
MEIRVPHSIIYKVEKPVPVSDFIISLLASEQLLRDCAPLLEGCFPGLTVEKVEVSIGEITEGSLKEILIGTLFLAFQPALQKDVPMAIESLTGAHVPAGYDSIVTVIFCVLLFYGVDAVYTQLNKGAFSKRLRAQLKDVTTELSRECGLSEEKIAHILESKYGKSRLRLIAHAATNFFTVSKRANNAPVMISNRNLDHEYVSEVPSDAQIEEGDVPEIVRQFENVQIEIHAQDVDRTRVGWAAIVPSVAPKRMKMELYPPIKPEDLYTKRHIRGDIAVVFEKKADGSYKPSLFHLMAIKG